MCGIAGLVTPDASAGGRTADVRRMMDALAHRGPDGEGLSDRGQAVLGHRRLAIIDLSTGAQPMTSHDGRLTLTFNGEIYNYLELRQGLVQRGYRFATSSDTEVLLYLYDCFGVDCLQQLNGMFAFALWDADRNELFCARDRFGIKPFYFTQVGEGFYFASEIKAFRELPDFRAEMDPDGLAEYLHFQFCLGDRTLFRNVRRLEPGQYLRIRPGGRPEVRDYWGLNFQVDTEHTSAYFVDRLRFLLGDAVRYQLRSDVPVGAYLSGGIDSSTVACLAADMLGGGLQTFTGSFHEGPQYDESPHARAVAEHIGALHHEIFPTADEFVEDLPRLISAMDEPAAGPGLFPQYHVARLAQRHVKVVLGGQGGDEVFGGYARYLACYLEACLLGAIDGTTDQGQDVLTLDTILPALPTLQQYKPMLRHFWSDGLFDAPDRRYFRLVDRSEGVSALYEPGAWSNYDAFAAFQGIFNRPELGSLFNRMTYFDIRTLLPALLQVEDRVSMAVSLESRVPLLDHRIPELVATIPPGAKFREGRLKHLLLDAARHLLPARVTQRRDKMGFPVPLSEWCANGPVRDFVHDALLSQAARERGLYRMDEVRRLLANERPFGRQLWGLLCLELWQRTL